jgi:hypothetical protein
MKKLTSVAGAGITALTLGLALVGCGGSDSSTEATSSTSGAEESSTSSEEAAATTPAEAAGPKETIQDYVKQNDIQEVAVQPGDPMAPTIALPVPTGWQQTDQLPNAPFGAIVFTQSKVPDNPPRVLALMSKLVGDVDTQALLDYAPGELQNMPGWVGNEGKRITLSGYDAFQIGGTYEIDGKKGMIAQETVVVPAEDGVFVLQLNAYSDQSEAQILTDATITIDNEVVITP